MYLFTYLITIVLFCCYWVLVPQPLVFGMVSGCMSSLRVGGCGGVYCRIAERLLVVVFSGVFVTFELLWIKKIYICIFSLWNLIYCIMYYVFSVL